jgi:hypothetical protein
MIGLLILFIFILNFPSPVCNALLLNAIAKSTQKQTYCFARFIWMGPYHNQKPVTVKISNATPIRVV